MTDLSYLVSLWVNIDEKMPDKGVKVLTINERGFQHVQHRLFDKRASGNEALFNKESVMYGLVTHWMPLPPSPCLEGEGDE